MYDREGRHNNLMCCGGGGSAQSALKLKTASEFDSLWMSTLNKAQLRREGGRGHDNTLRGGEDRVSLL